MTTPNGFFPVNQEEVEKQAGNSPIVFLKEGITQIRILPPYSEQGVWCKEIREHSATNDGKYITLPCPKYHADNDCPFCEEGKKLYELGDEASVQAAKEFKTKRAFLFNVLVYSSPGSNLTAKSGVKVLKTGITVQRQVFDLDQDAAGGWGNVTDLEKGFDIRITAKGQGRSREYIVKGVPNRNSVLDTLTAQGISLSDFTPHNLDSLVMIPSYNKMKTYLETSRPKAAEMKLAVEPLVVTGSADSKVVPPAGEVQF